jgi:hypothetical protein
MTVTNSKFTLGQIVATPGALEALAKAGQTPHELLARHVRCEWAGLDAEDVERNMNALQDQSRIFGAFVLKDGTKLWCITEAVGDDGQRASTCLLLPDEY